MLFDFSLIEICLDSETILRLYNTISMWLGEVTDELKSEFDNQSTDKCLEAEFLRDLALKYINDELWGESTPLLKSSNSKLKSGRAFVIRIHAN